MKKLLKYIANITMILSVPAIVLAGNEDRVGQSGAHELLINPWAQSSGWGGSNSALVRGVESMSSNIGGLSFVRGTEVAFSHNNWLKGSDIKIESFGLTVKSGESGTIGISVMSMNFGEIERTTEDQPDGGAGTYKPQFINIGIGYSKAFSNSIHGGMLLRIVSESLSDVKATGVAVDAGIQYVTGFNEAKDNLKFGISLRNVGTPMKYSGEGLTYRNQTVGSAQTINVLQEQRTENFEMPSLINIGVSYDLKLAADHRLTPAVSFTSNSFIRDQFALGLEYGFRSLFMLRVGYTVDKKDKNAIITDEISSLIGPSAGVTVQAPLGKSKTKTIGIDYSYRSTKTFDGTHSIGIKLGL